MTVRRSRLVPALAAAVLLALAASCGGGDDEQAETAAGGGAATTTQATGGTTPETSGPPADYSGVEATLPTEYPTPEKQDVECTFGFQSPIAANETLSFWQRGFTRQAEAFGCEVIALDDELSPDKQVSNMQQLLAQDVDAIVFYPIDPQATVPVLRQADRRGIPVLAVDATFGSPDATAPYLPYVTTQVWQGRDIQAFLQAQALAETAPNAKVGLIGIGAPVPALKYLNEREAHWIEQGGATVLGTQDNPSDDIAGGQQAANGLLQRHQDLTAIVGYNDPSALGAVAAARGAGREIVSIGLNGSSDGLEGVRAGRLSATVQVDAVGWGQQQAIAAYNLVTEQNLPLPKIIVRPSRLVTEANIDEVETWQEQVDAIE